MRLAIIDSLMGQPGQEIGPIFTYSLSKPEIGEQVRLSFWRGQQGMGEIISVSGNCSENWSYKVKVIEVF